MSTRPVATQRRQRVRPAPVSRLTSIAQLASALVCLLLGVVIYALARPVPAWLLPIALHAPQQVGDGWQVLVGSAPTFLHVVAFSLLMAVVAGGGRTAAALSCVGWTTGNLLFELGQHPVASQVLARHMPSGFDRLWLLDRVRPYFEHGSFDPNDLCAAVLGGAFAYAITCQFETELNHEQR